MNLEMILSVGVLLGLVAMPTIAPLLVFRGRRFWAPWTMIGAVVFFILAFGAQLAVQTYLGKKMQEQLAAVGGKVSDSPEYYRLLELMGLTAVVFGGLVVLSCLTYAAGFLGVAFQWKETSRRAKELEAKTAALAARRETVTG